MCIQDLQSLVRARDGGSPCVTRDQSCDQEQESGEQGSIFSSLHPREREREREREKKKSHSSSIKNISSPLGEEYLIFMDATHLKKREYAQAGALIPFTQKRKENNNGKINGQIS